jgi:hypothetical protein
MTSGLLRRAEDGSGTADGVRAARAAARHGPDDVAA